MHLTEITELLILTTKVALLICYLIRLLFICFYILQVLRTELRADLSMQNCSPSHFLILWDKSPTMMYWGRGLYTHMYLRGWWYWVSFLASLHLIFETRLLTETKVHQLARLLDPRDPPVSPFQCWGHRCILLHLASMWLLRI